MKQFFLTCLACSALGVGTLCAQESVTASSSALKLKFDTRLTFDGALYLPQTNLDEVKHFNSNNRIEDFRFSNGANISQVRFGIWATLSNKWRGKIDVDFANRQVGLRDIFLDYFFSPNTYIKMGYYKDPVSMENNTASKFLSLATPSAIQFLTTLNRYWGATFVHWDKHYWIGAGLYASNVSGQTTQPNRGNDGVGVSAKAAWVPVNELGRTVYLGLYGRYRTPDLRNGKQGILTLSTLPESGNDARRFISASITGVKNYIVSGLEASVTHRRFHASGEYLINRVNLSKDMSRETMTFHGGFITGSFMLRGNQRKYLPADAMFTPTANVAPGGNLELTARLSYLNANDTSGTGEAARYGSSFSQMVGLNWYPNGNVLFGINYTYMNMDRYAQGSGLLLVPDSEAATKGLDFHTLQFRLQYIF